MAPATSEDGSRPRRILEQIDVPINVRVRSHTSRIRRIRMLDSLKIVCDGKRMGDKRELCVIFISFSEETYFGTINPFSHLCVNTLVISVSRFTSRILHKYVTPFHSIGNYDYSTPFR